MATHQTGYAKGVPDGDLFPLPLTPAQRQIYGAIKSLNNRYPHCSATNATLALKAGVSIRTVVSAKKVLSTKFEELGWQSLITIEERHGDKGQRVSDIIRLNDCYFQLREAGRKLRLEASTHSHDSLSSHAIPAHKRRNLKRFVNKVPPKSGSSVHFSFSKESFSIRSPEISDNFLDALRKDLFKSLKDQVLVERGILMYACGMIKADVKNKAAYLTKLVNRGVLPPEDKVREISNYSQYMHSRDIERRKEISVSMPMPPPPFHVPMISGNEIARRKLALEEANRRIKEMFT